MALLPINVDYTDKDFDALRARLFRLISSVFPTWTDQNKADFGNLLVELFAHVGDVIGFYQDNQANESRIVTATQRKSLLGLVKLIGYVPSGAGAASVDVNLTIPAIMAGSVTFPAGTVVETGDVTGAVKFQLLAAAVIPAGSTSVTASVENSENAQDVFTSSGLANQEFALNATPYLDDSSTVIAADGAYVQKTDFLSSTSADKHFVVVVDQNDRARVRFGNGTNGAIPTGTVTVTYKTGGGPDGNVDPGAISKVDGSFTDSLGTPVIPSVTNPTRASGGRSRQSNAAIKAFAPASIRAPVNSIAREDFVINALRLPGVARALMLTADQDLSVPENTGFLYVVPVGGGVPSTDLKNAVRTMVTVTYPAPLTFTVNVSDPLYKQIDVSVTIFKQPGFSGATLKAAITAALQTYFQPQNADGTPNAAVEFGGNMLDATGVVSPVLAWSDLFDVVRDIAGVRKIDAGGAGFLLNGVRGDVTLSTKEFPTLGTVTVIDGDTSTVI